MDKDNTLVKTLIRQWIKKADNKPKQMFQIVQNVYLGRKKNDSKKGTMRVYRSREEELKQPFPLNS